MNFKEAQALYCMLEHCKPVYNMSQRIVERAELHTGAAIVAVAKSNLIHFNTLQTMLDKYYAKHTPKPAPTPKL